MFVKFLITGAEFITSTAVMTICPIIYYSIIEQKNIKDVVFTFIKSSLVAIGGIIAGFVVLITQIKFYAGTWQAGIDHIIFSFTKRSAGSDALGGHTVGYVLKTYLTESSIFMWDFAPNIAINFGIVTILILIVCLLAFTLNKRSDLPKTERTINNALIAITIISITGPLSWIIIFAQHAYIHTPFDYITWYMPFCIYGFIMFGTTIKLVSKQVTRNKI